MPEPDTNSVFFKRGARRLRQAKNFRFQDYGQCVICWSPCHFNTGLVGCCLSLSSLQKDSRSRYFKYFLCFQILILIFMIIKSQTYVQQILHRKVPRSEFYLSSTSKEIAFRFWNPPSGQFQTSFAQ